MDKISFESLEIGDIFNQRWQILSILGKGGFGIVYRALDLNIDGREVAIKILTIDTSQFPDALIRFKKEVSITSKLKSKNTLTIYDFGIIQNSAYMVSELLIGETLEAKIQRISKLSEDESLNIIQSVAEVLAEAHHENIVHRDIKPDNIFLHRENREKNGYVVKLIDFGIAKVIEESSQKISVHMTATHSFFGTPLYMSPEQMIDTSKVNAKSDIYSLGLVLYTCLVGKLPFETNDLYHLLKEKMENKLPAIPFKLNQYENINLLISKMTAGDQKERIATMNDVIDSMNVIKSNQEMTFSNIHQEITMLQEDFDLSKINIPVQNPKDTIDMEAFLYTNSSYSDHSHTKPSHTKPSHINHLNVTAHEVKKSNISQFSLFILLIVVSFLSSIAYQIYHRKDQINTNHMIKPTIQTIIEKPIIEKPIIEKPIIEKPIIEKPIIEKPMIKKSIIEKPMIKKSIIEKPKSIDPKPNEINTIKSNPIPQVQEHAFISVQSSVWGSVFVNDRQVSHETPLLNYKVNVGDIKVKICFMGDINYCTEKLVVITPNERKILKF